MFFSNNSNDKKKWSPSEYFSKKLEETKLSLIKEWEELDREIVKDPVIRAQGWRYCDKQTKPVTLPCLGDLPFKRTRMKIKLPSGKWKTSCLLDEVLGIRKLHRIHDEIKIQVAKMLVAGMNRPQIVREFAKQGVSFSLQEVSRINKNLDKWLPKNGTTSKIQLGVDNTINLCMDDFFIPLRVDRKVILHRARLISATTGRIWDASKKRWKLEGKSRMLQLSKPRRAKRRK